MIGYDLDGVLAHPAPRSPKKWGRMSGAERLGWKHTMNSWYAMAPRLLNPKEPQFHVITARKDTAEIRRITQHWLDKHFPGRVLGLHMLQESRSIENVVKFKGDVIRKLGITQFTEDNMKVLKGLASKGCRAQLLYFDPVKFLEI